MWLPDDFTVAVAAWRRHVSADEGITLTLYPLKLRTKTTVKSNLRLKYPVIRGYYVSNMPELTDHSGPLVYTNLHLGA
jgi:hypothetical protein